MGWIDSEQIVCQCGEMRKAGESALQIGRRQRLHFNGQIVQACSGRQRGPDIKKRRHGEQEIQPGTEPGFEQMKIVLLLEMHRPARRQGIAGEIHIGGFFDAASA